MPSVKKTSLERLSSEPINGSWETVNRRAISSREKLVIDKRSITLVNIERPVWHDVTKAALIEYYISVSEYLLPHLRDRPVGINISLYDPKDSFFLRGMEGHAPDWATLFVTDRKHKKAGKSDKIEWLVCNDLATLVWIVNLESIDIHPWGSRTTSPDFPDYIVIDLDPSDGDFKKVVATARAAKKLFDRLKLKSFVKTSGKTGMHIFLPCSAIPFGESRNVAEALCAAIHAMVPSITTLDTRVASRGDLLYVDPSQNDYADRVAAAYCVRAFHEPRVSAPLLWREVNDRLDPAKFTLSTMPLRLQQKGDLWKDILDPAIASGNDTILKELL